MRMMVCELPKNCSLAHAERDVYMASARASELWRSGFCVVWGFSMQSVSPVFRARTPRDPNEVYMLYYKCIYYTTFCIVCVCVACSIYNLHAIVWGIRDRDIVVRPARSKYIFANTQKSSHLNACELDLGVLCTK